jgi:flagellar basal body P-ring formation protein FlgA
MRRDWIKLTLCILVGYSVPLPSSIASTIPTEQQLMRRLDALLALPSRDGDIVRHATLLATPQQIAALCDQPALRLAGKDTRWVGRRTLVARCSERQHFLPIRIHAEGTWWVARHALSAGHLIAPADIVEQRGNLEGQPANIMFRASDILGQRLTRDIAAGKPLLPNLLRQQWLLRAGQTVEIVASGRGFHIRSQGKALDHAAANGKVRVQTRNGQTLNGVVTAEGHVKIPLAQ